MTSLPMFQKNPRPLLKSSGEEYNHHHTKQDKESVTYSICYGMPGAVL